MPYKKQRDFLKGLYNNATIQLKEDLVPAKLKPTISKNLNSWFTHFYKLLL